MPVSTPQVCPVVVEREAELKALESLLAGAAAGRGRLAVLIGDAGMGKSRLAREAVSRAEASGFQILAGGSLEQDRDFPFAPIIDALRQRIMTTPGGARAFLDPQSDALAGLLPELRDPATSPVAAPPPSAESGKRRLFETIAALLGRLAAAQPLLLVLEDAHWADATTLELLEVLPRRLSSARCLILVAARSDEPNPDLRRYLATLRRGRDLVELSVEPLSEAGVDRMLRALLGTPPPPALISTVHRRTGGNPFFIEELLAAVPARSTGEWLLGELAVPESIKDIILKRAADLPTDAQRIADLASVAGQRVDFKVLRAASGLETDALLDAIRPLVDRRLLVDESFPGGTRLAFRHALTRDALRSRLLTPERQALHRRIGDALERTSDRNRVPADIDGELGYHFHAAGVWDKTLDHALRAGDAAWRVHATVEALTHDSRALDAALALHNPLAAELHRRCGHALARIGAIDAARKHLESARALARSHGRVDVEQASLHDLAGLFASRDYATARQLAEESLALARAGPDLRREALALNRLGNMLTNLRRFDEGRALHEEALRSFDALGDAWGRADSWDLIGMTRYLAGEAPEAREAFRRAAAMFAALGDVEREASARTSSGIYLAILDGPCAADASPAAYRADALEGLRLSRRIAWRAGEAYALAALAGVDAGDGRFGDALRHGETALAIAEEIGHDQWQVITLLTLGIVAIEMLDTAGALERFERARDLAHAAGAAQFLERLDAWVASCRQRLGETDVPLPVVPDEVRPASIGQRRALMSLAERQLAAGSPEAALATMDRLLLGAAGPRPAGANLLRGDALAALGRDDEADAAYLDARRVASDVGPRSVLWHAAAARSRLWRDRDPAEAERERAIARAEILALAGSVPDGARRDAFLRAPAIRPLIAPAGRRRTRPSADHGGLTPREREVAACVARGLSNKEIARELGVAEKTVEMHVGNCLGKLGFPSRARLAAWTVAAGLAEPPQSLG